MAVSNAQIDKKLRQHDNEIVAIYDMLVEIRGTMDGHTTMLAQHSQTLDQHTETLDQHTEMLTEILRRLPEAS
jgi:hypothetical protein